MTMIRLPEEQRKGFTKKYYEYLDRLSVQAETLKKEHEYSHIDLFKASLFSSDAFLKALVLGELLNKKSLDSELFSLKIFEDSKNQRWIDALKTLGLARTFVDNYNMACGVINDYCETGGRNTLNGTGLPLE